MGNSWLKRNAKWFWTCCCLLDSKGEFYTTREKCVAWNAITCTRAKWKAGKRSSAWKFPFPGYPVTYSTSRCFPSVSSHARVWKQCYDLGLSVPQTLSVAASSGIVSVGSSRAVSFIRILTSVAWTMPNYPGQNFLSWAVPNTNPTNLPEATSWAKWCCIGFGIQLLYIVPHEHLRFQQKAQAVSSRCMEDTSGTLTWSSQPLQLLLSKTRSDKYISSNCCLLSLI